MKHNDNDRAFLLDVERTFKRGPAYAGGNSSEGMRWRWASGQRLQWFERRPDLNRVIFETHEAAIETYWEALPDAPTPEEES